MQRTNGEIVMKLMRVTKTRIRVKTATKLVLGR